MAKGESNITSEILLEMSKHGVKLFRNVRGNFLTLDGLRHIAAGLQPNGSSDLIGFTELFILDKKVCVFTAIEVKTITGRVSPKQQKYIDNIKKSGGIAFVARSTSEAVNEHRKQMDGISSCGQRDA